MRTFIYCRVSTAEQDSNSQVLAIKQKGFEVPEHRIFSETISGKTRISSRPVFSSMLAKMEKGDRVIVLSIDRLGRNTIEILSTLDMFANLEIQVLSLDLGIIDLNSPSAKLYITVLSAVAEMERNLISERTKEGLERAKAQGKKLGKPRIKKSIKQAILNDFDNGITNKNALAKEYGISRSSVCNILNEKSQIKRS